MASSRTASAGFPKGHTPTPKVVRASTKADGIASSVGKRVNVRTGAATRSGTNRPSNFGKHPLDFSSRGIAQGNPSKLNKEKMPQQMKPLGVTKKTPGPFGVPTKSIVNAGKAVNSGKLSAFSVNQGKVARPISSLHGQFAKSGAGK